MAETAVALLLDKLQQLLCREAEIFRGVHDDVKLIMGQLQLINSFLKDADAQAEAESTSNVVKTWGNQMREVAFLMEDVIDQYLLKVVERGQRHGVLGVATKSKEKLKSLTHRHDIASEIQKIRKIIGDRYTAGAALNFRSSAAAEGASTSTPYRRLGAYCVEESRLVGINHNRKVLTNWLYRPQSKFSVMVVAGPGGIGKTTIVKNVYKEAKEENTFQFYAWITVSRTQDNNMLFRAIMQNIPEDHPNASGALGIETADPASLVSEIKEYLESKKYLIVFDDVSKSNFWDDIQHALPDSNKSSRAIITARDEGVAAYCGINRHVDVHKLKPLSPNDALELFLLKAFQQEGYPDELKDLSEYFVKKCNGLPLAIVAIAALLSTKKKTVAEWGKVQYQFSSLLETNQHLESVQQVMSESYHDLPPHLKRCLLYFGLFPEDYSISCMRLIRLWVAEGFVKEKEDENNQKISMEEFAEEYLAELFRRCLVQVSQVGFDGKPRSCHVHDLMHEFILRKCKDQMFCQVMKDEITHSESSEVGRRLSIQMNEKDISDAMRRPEKWSRVRSCFVLDGAKKGQVTPPFFSSFELLVGLDLSDARLDHLPEQVGKLLNLKYLSLRDNKIKSLPKSVGKLEKLQTLDLKRTQVHELPEEIENLIKLRHLLAYYINNQRSGLDALQGVKLKKGLQNLTSLQKLSFLDATNAASVIEELKQLTQLRKLGIIKLARQCGEALCRAIENMNHLCSLSIGAMKSHELLELQSLRNPPSSLQRLYLYGRLERFPNWIPKLVNLVRLYLKWSGLEEDPLPYLKDLSELLQLELYDTYGGEELHFKNGWLKSLKVLHLESMPKLKTIKIDNGALPHLSELKIGKCHEMVHVPRDLQNLRSLKSLHLYDMPEHFINRMKGPQGEDSWIVSKIPLVHCSKDDHSGIPNLYSLNDELDGSW